MAQRRALASLLLLFLLATTSTLARDEWFRGLDLEEHLSRAELVVAARVTEMTETTIVVGGKGEQPGVQQFTFVPVRTLKGFYTRDALRLTGDDLVRGYDKEPLAAIQRGDMRLLILGRSGIGYANLSRSENLAHSVPPLRGEDDPLLAAVETLLNANRERDRVRKAALLLDGLRTANGPAAVPLLHALQRRALPAAQMKDAMSAVARHLGDGSPAVRETAAQTIEALLDADYLDQPAMRAEAVAALARSLEKAGADFAAKVAAFDALGAAGEATVRNEKSRALLQLDRPTETLAEQAARLRAIGRLKQPDRLAGIAAFHETMPLDAPDPLQEAAGASLARLDAVRAADALRQRLKRKLAAGLPVVVEIQLLGELPAADAVPALVEAAGLPLDRAERAALAGACARVPDARLVPVLATMLDPRQPEVRYFAVNALLTNGTQQAATALRPHLGEELDLGRKLRLAEFLGRHGFRDGYPYAVEHMNAYAEQAAEALASIRDPKTVEQLRRILETSNDVGWNAAAVRALGRFGAKEFAPRFVEMAQDLKNALAPAALVALGDLGQTNALPKVREALSSRNHAVVWAGARAAGKLLARPGVEADDVRAQLAALLADPDAPARQEAFEALLALNDRRLDDAARTAVRDARLEGSPLLQRIEALLRERRLALDLP